MTLSNYLRPARSAKEEILMQGANSIIKTFVQDIKDNKNHPPVVLADYKNRLLRFDMSWKRDVSKIILKGRRVKHIMLQGANKYNIDTFVKAKYDYIIHHKTGSFAYMTYSMEKFIELSKLEIAMLLFKYEDDLIEFEVKIAITELLTNYFELCNCNVVTGTEIWQWCFQPEELDNCLNILLNTPIQEYSKYSHYFTNEFKLEKHYRPEEIKYDTKVSPKNEEELLSRYREGMTKKQFDISIADYYGVSERTARNWRKEFGLTRLYVSKDKNNVDVSEISNDFQKRTSEYENTISQLKQEIEDKNSTIESLRNDITKLEKELREVTEHNDPEYLRGQIKAHQANAQFYEKKYNELYDSLMKYQQENEKLKAILNSRS